jgi:putative SbcD/Mre11-related phosphoesterase
LDARRAIYFPNAQTVAVADLHLGYAWVQRKRGALLPVSAPDSTYSRLASLLANYPVRELVVLGDLVHQALGLPQIEEALRALAAVVSRDITLTLCAGNHDQKLANLVLRWKLPLRIVSALSVGRYLLHHGDGKPNESDFRLDSGDRVHVIGHEHPALRLGDGVATSAKVPCFLVSDDVVVVPAFSDWAAGCVYLRDRFLGEVAQRATFHAAYACMGPRLLKFPLR